LIVVCGVFEIATASSLVLETKLTRNAPGFAPPMQCVIAGMIA
jgi:hypothetical protein